MDFIFFIYTRFEKENINTLEMDSELLITMMGAFAQAESESMSANVTWGKRQAMREGRAIIQYKHPYEKDGAGAAGHPGLQGRDGLVRREHTEHLEK